MSFEIGQKVFWKKQECEIVGVEKGKQTTKPDYQNGILFNGFIRSAKRYVLNTGEKVTGQDIINHQKLLKKNERCEKLIKEAERQFNLNNTVTFFVYYKTTHKPDLWQIDNLEGAKDAIRDMFFRKLVEKIII